jgi:hypothetical protein
MTSDELKAGGLLFIINHSAFITSGESGAGGDKLARP